MNAFREWYIKHQDAITWFIIGVCVMAGLGSLAAGDYTNALVNFFIAGLNYALNNHKLKL